MLRSVARAVVLVERDGDPSELSDDDVVEDAQDLRGFVTLERRGGAPLLDRAVAEKLAFFHWYRHRFLGTEVAADEAVFAISLFRRLTAVDQVDRVVVPPAIAVLFDPDADPRSDELDEDDVRAIVSCAQALFDHAGSDDGVDGGGDVGVDGHEPASAIALARHAMALARRPGELDPAIRAELALVLLDLADHTDDGDEDALEQAAANARTALLGTPPDRTEWLRRANVLGLVRVEAAKVRGDEDALREAIDLLWPAVRAADPGHPGRPAAATTLLYAATVRHGWPGDSDLAAEPVAGLRELLDLVPDGESGRDDTIAALAVSLWDRYLTESVPHDELPFTISLFAHLYPVEPELVPTVLVPLFDPTVDETVEDEADLHILVSCARDLYAYADDEEDDRREELDRAVEMARRAVAVAEAVGRLDADTRGELAAMLLTTFHQTQDVDLLDATVRHARVAVADTPPDHEDRLGRVGVLGGALAEVADARDDDAALRQAIALLGPAVHGATSEHPGLLPAAIALFRALTLRAGRNTAVTSFAESARDLNALLDVFPDVPLRASVEFIAINTEAWNLLYLGDLSGVRAAQAALDGLAVHFTPGTPDHDRYRLSAASLSVVLVATTGALAPGPEFARYREVFHGATALDPDERAVNLGMLCTLLGLYADPAMYVTPAGGLDLLDESVTLLTDGLATVPADTAEHRTLLAVLGATLLRRFRATGDRADLERATILLRDRRSYLAHRRTADPTDLHTVRSELAYALREHYLLTRDEHAYQEAMGLLMESIADPDSYVMSRLSDAYTAGDLAVRAGRWREATDAYAAGIGLSAQPSQVLRRPDVEQQLALWSGIANEAAATSVLAGDLDRAVGLLEYGRAILVHQELDVRGDTALLRGRHPDLADRLDQVRATAERADEPRHRREVAAQWQHLLTEIRSRPGFASFLRQPPASALRVSEGQTVVLVNPADVGSCALLVTAAGVSAVPLPALTTADVRDRVAAFNQALADLTMARDRPAAVETVADTLDWLWHSTAEPVLTALGHLGPPPETDPWPRIHWCPTWMLTFLPLHAAAARRPAEPGSSVLDRVVSSYALSLRTLRLAVGREDPPPDRRSLLVVALPRTPGLPPLDGARLETAGLVGLGPPTTVLTGDEAVRDAVSTAMREHAWAHFACHAGQDLAEPSRGRLLLHDHREQPLTVLDISRLRLEHAQLAFLSACDTARGGLRLPDEAIHVGGALQLAGYQHVIATLWGVRDVVASRMTARVYEDLRTADGGALAPGRAAVALHAATRALREQYPADPSLWAGYVHFGP